jgi:hypothetical protein
MKSKLSYLIPCSSMDVLFQLLFLDSWPLKQQCTKLSVVSIVLPKLIIKLHVQVNHSAI